MRPACCGAASRSGGCCCTLARARAQSEKCNETPSKSGLQIGGAARPPRVRAPSMLSWLWTGVLGDFLAPEDEAESEMNTELFQASLAGDVERVEHLLRRGADPAVAMRSGNTALHAAAARGHAAVAEALIRFGAVPGAVGARGNTPLHLAAANAHHEVVAAVLAGGGASAAIARNAAGFTPAGVLLSAYGLEGASREAIEAADPRIGTCFALLQRGAVEAEEAARRAKTTAPPAAPGGARGREVAGDPAGHPAPGSEDAHARDESREAQDAAVAALLTPGSETQLPPPPSSIDDQVEPLLASTLAHPGSRTHEQIAREIESTERAVAEAAGVEMESEDSTGAAAERGAPPAPSDASPVREVL